MATIDRAFHVSVTPEIHMPVIIPAAEIPDVLLEPDGYSRSYVATRNPDEAHRMALHWLGAEKAMRKLAADEEAQKAAEKQRKEAEDAAKLHAEAVALCNKVVGLPFEGQSPAMNVQYWTDVAKAAREVHGVDRERTRHE
jgi:hypothetical protein